jgi:hypothetical protein
MYALAEPMNIAVLRGTLLLFKTVNEMYALADEIVGPLKALRCRQHCAGI